MDAQLKKYLEVFSKYMETKGCNLVEWSGDYYGLNLYGNNPDCISGYRRSQISNPLPLQPLLEKYLDENQKDFDFEGEDPYAMEVEFNREDMTLSVFEIYSDYGTEETGGLVKTPKTVNKPKKLSNTSVKS